ncbi:MAG: DegT/DnrJ/EryC1/StrS family aminotransferase [Nitrosopumilaceae archaeon]
MKIKTRDPFDSSIKVPFFLPQITRDDKRVVNNALSSTLLTDGPKLRQFELAFAKFTGTNFAIGVSNGTSALHLALKSIGIGKGDEVIIPDMTFVATASAVLFTGATPVLADINSEDMNISVDSIQRCITKKTKAILPVHFAGKICDINRIKKIAKSNNLIIIEDCAHAIGARSENKHVGSFGVAGCFSFYPTKNITTIEGGMVITNSKKIAQYVRSARNHGITKSLKQRFSHGKPWDYDVMEPGYNYRLDEIRSALGISQLKRIKKINLQRKKACQYYNSKLKNIKGMITPSISSNNDNAFHLYIIRIQKNFGLSRDRLFHKLLKHGIRTSVHYKPLHEFTIFRKKAKIYDKLDNTKQAYKEIISLPLYPQISRMEQDKVIDCIIN